MEIKQISEHCYCSIPIDYGDRPSIGYITNKRQAALIDAGNSKSQLNEFLSLIDEKGLPKPNVVYLTHSHWDHTFGLSALDSTTKIVSTTKTSLKISEENTKLLNTAKDLCIESNKTGESFTSLIQKSITLPSERYMLEKIFEEYGLDFSQIKIVNSKLHINDSESSFDDNYPYFLKMFVIKSPHSTDSAIYYVESDKVLFLGDSAYKDLDKENYSNFEVANKITFFYKKLEKIPFQIAVLAHSKMLTKEQLLAFIRKTYGLK